MGRGEWGRTPFIEIGAEPGLPPFGQVGMIRQRKSPQTSAKRLRAEFWIRGCADLGSLVVPA